MRNEVELFPHLALTLAQWARVGFVPLLSQAPHFSAWRGTLSMLSMRMNMRHLKDAHRPQCPSIDQIPQLFTQPLRDWYPDPLDTLPDDIDPDLPLLQEPLVDESSLDEQVVLYLNARDMTGNLSPYGLRAIIDQRWMRDLVHWGRKDPASRESEYRLIRRFLIEHPWTTEAELSTRLSSLRIYNPALVGDKYEQACVFDPSVRYKGQYWLCPHCQGLLYWVHGRPRCAKHICERLYPGYQGMRSVAPRLDIRRLSWILHVRVCLPGQTELALYERLRELEAAGLRITLWAGVDAYDHRVDFPWGQRWADDVKDYESPVTLARTLLKEPFPRYEDVPDLKWDRAFYVIPHYRLQLNPHYLRTVHDLTKYHAAFHDITFCDEEQFYTLVVQESAMRCLSSTSP